MWIANAVVMFIQIIHFFLLLICCREVYFRVFGTLCNCFMGLFCTIPLSIITLVIRLNPIGTRCSYNTAKVDYTKGKGFGFDMLPYDTYADDGEKLFALAITGLILGCCQITLCNCPLLLTHVKNFDSHKKVKKVEVVKKVVQGLDLKSQPQEVGERKAPTLNEL